MSKLRQLMIRELELHRKSENTIKAYVASVRQLAKYYNRSPDQISLEEVRDFLRELIVTRKLAGDTVNVRRAGIKFFYEEVLRQPFDVRVKCKRSQKLPHPLSRREVTKLFEATSNLKHRTMLMTKYATGLRVGELVQLQIPDIRSDRMLVLVRNGKGSKQRYTLLSTELLRTLRAYWREYRPGHWLFPSPMGGGARFLFSVRALSKVYQAKYLDRLALLWEQAQLDLPPELQQLTATQRQRWLRKLRRHAWVVYSKPPFASPAKLLGYLSRYTHRVAISNERIVAKRWPRFAD